MKLFDISIYKNIIAACITGIKKTLVDRIINIIIWSSCTMLVSSYILTAFGITESFGSFQLAGLVASASFFQAYENIINLVIDFSHHRKINSWLLLPTSSLTIFAAMVTFYAITGLILGLILIPLGKILLLGRFSLMSIHWFKFFGILILSNIFFGCLSLLVAAKTTMATLGNVWHRVIFPIWFLGGFQFSWLALQKAIPGASYIFLLNPLLLINEAMRGSILGPDGYLNYWVCCAIVIAVTFVIFRAAQRALKKRLDFVI